MFNLKLKKFFSPDDTPGAAIEDKALDKESAIEFLGADDEKEETLELEESTKKGSKDKEEKPKEGDKEGEGEEKELSLEEELEAELEEPEIEDIADVAPPARREILAKYPTLFKDFPAIEKAIYREAKYSEILPTLEDAKEAVGKANQLDQYEKEIVAGSTESLLSAVRDNDRTAFNRVVDNYLPTLFKVDKDAYYHTVGNVIKRTIMSMSRDSKDRNDEDLGNAAAILNNYIFNTTTFTPPSNLSQEEVGETDQTKAKEKEVTDRERKFVERQFTTARDTLGEKVDNIIKATVDKAIDPNTNMPATVKKYATREVLEALEEKMLGDSRFRSIYDRLWEKAFENDFDAASMDTIKKAYLSKAKTLLPELIRKSRIDALKGLSRKTDNNEQKDKRGHLPVGKTRSSTTLTSGKPNGSNSKQTIPKGMTSLEYLNSDD